MSPKVSVVSARSKVSSPAITICPSLELRGAELQSLQCLFRKQKDPAAQNYTMGQSLHTPKHT